MSGEENLISNLSRGRQLTRKQREVLTAIQRFSTLKGYMPSVRELGRELGGLAPATVQHHLSTLRRKGYLEHDGAAHGVRLATPVMTPQAPSTTPVTDPRHSLRWYGDGPGGGGGRPPREAEDPWAGQLTGMQVVVPLLGTIAAGKPLEALEESDEYVPIPASFARSSAYVLRVSGSSMVEDGILDGDLV